MNAAIDTVLQRLRDRATTLAQRCARLEGGALEPFTGDLVRIRAAANGLEAKIENVADTLDADHSEVAVAKARHDLRALIGAVKGYGELIIEELEDAPSAQTPEAVDALSVVVSDTILLLPTVDELRRSPNRYASMPPPPLFSAGDNDVHYAPRFRGCVVLHIDDNDDNRHILARRLRPAGLQIHGVSSGEQGLAYLKEHHVDLVLLDVNMPGMSGLDVLKAVRSDRKLTEIPVLVISAVSEVVTIVRCIEAGAQDYLATPFNPTILHARIKACLDKKILSDLDREHLKALEHTRQELESAIESMEEGFAIFDADLRLRRSNGKFRALYGLQSDHVTGLEAMLRNCHRRNLFFDERRRAEDPPETEDDFVRLRLARYRATEPSMERLRDGRWLEIRNRPLPDGGIVSVHKDVTEFKKDEERLTYLANHDPLTGLANRSAFEEALTALMASPSPFVLLYLDLDGFKAINDTLGHQAGDALLQKVAADLRALLRDGDVVARLGGDEFVAVVRGIDSPEALHSLGKRVLGAIGGTFGPAGNTLPYGVSVGAAPWPSPAEGPEELIAEADGAMYRAKREGKGRVRVVESTK